MEAGLYKTICVFFLYFSFFFSGAFIPQRAIRMKVDDYRLIGQVSRKRICGRLWKDSRGWRKAALTISFCLDCECMVDLRADDGERKGNAHINELHRGRKYTSVVHSDDFGVQRLSKMMGRFTALTAAITTTTWRSSQPDGWYLCRMVPVLPAWAATWMSQMTLALLVAAACCTMFL